MLGVVARGAGYPGFEKNFKKYIVIDHVTFQKINRELVYPLNTNHFSKLTKDNSPSDLPKFSASNNIGVEHSLKFSRQNFEITNLPKFSPPEFCTIWYQFSGRTKFGKFHN